MTFSVNDLASNHVIINKFEVLGQNSWLVESLNRRKRQEYHRQLIDEGYHVIGVEQE